MLIVIFGAGRMAQIRAEALRREPTVSEIVVANRSPAKARELAESVQGRACSLEDGLAMDMDAAIVTVSTAHHASLLEPLLVRAVPTLCEKPLTLDIRTTTSILETAQTHHALLHVGYQRRFDDEFAAARLAIGSGELGIIYHMRMVSHDFRSSPEEFIVASGGIFRDLHVHDFDLASWLFDSPIASVYAAGSVRASEQYQKYGDFDSAVIVAALENGVPVLVSGTRQNPRGQDVRVELFGSRDCVNVGAGAASEPRPFATWVDHSWRRDAYSGFIDRFRQAFHKETRAFVASVATGGESVVPGEADLRALRVAEACERSCAEGRVVRVAEV